MCFSRTRIEAPVCFVWRSYVCGKWPDLFPEYDPLMPWLAGTTADELVLDSWPFKNIFDDYDGGDTGYTHGDIITRTLPSTTPYSFDTLMHHYQMPLYKFTS
tara:strand:+ start:1544 stop:1849 length:306 start_codon:yes stop_codon:yes gene_type:complete